MFKTKAKRVKNKLKAIEKKTICTSARITRSMANLIKSVNLSKNNTSNTPILVKKCGDKNALSRNGLNKKTSLGTRKSNRAAATIAISRIKSQSTSRVRKAKSHKCSDIIKCIDAKRKQKCNGNKSVKIEKMRKRVGEEMDIEETLPAKRACRRQSTVKTNQCLRKTVHITASSEVLTQAELDRPSKSNLLNNVTTAELQTLPANNGENVVTIEKLPLENTNRNECPTKEQYSKTLKNTTREFNSVSNLMTKSY